MTAAWVVATLLASPQQPVPYPDAPRIAYEEFEALHADGKVLVVDVRSAEAYAGGHISGAISMPLGEVEKHATELTRAAGPRTLVVYCA